MDEFYSNFMLDVFGVEIDDGSIARMANITCELFRQIRNNDRQLYDDVIRTSQELSKVQVISQTLDRTDLPPLEDGEEELDQNVMEGRTNVALQNPLMKSEIESDTVEMEMAAADDNNINEEEEEGWTVVRKNRKWKESKN